MAQMTIISKKQIFRNILALLMLAVTILAGCEGQVMLDSVFSNTGEPTAQPQMDEVDASASPTPNPSPTAPAFYTLTLWLPPQFDPSAENASSELFNDRLRGFLEENPQVTLDVRIKPSGGSGSILEALTLTSTVATDAMPSLVLLSRSDLETAVSRGLRQPIEETSSAIDESDWFGYAQELAILHGTAYGLPFAGDAMGLVYRAGVQPAFLSSWDGLIGRSVKVIFPAGDPAALVTWTLYRTAGGIVQNQQGQPAIDSAIMEKVFDNYQQGTTKRSFSADMLDYQTDDQAWEVFISGQGSAAITWVSRVMNDTEVFSFISLPPLNDQPYTAARGWVWCLVERDTYKKEASIALLEHLAAPDFLRAWTPIAGYLPVRPSSLDGWQDPEIKQDIQELLQHAKLRPGSEVTTVMSASLKEAVRKIMLLQSSPLDAVVDFMDRLEVNEEK
jgi:multiple sugar transport system substrate-binding protein